MGGFFSFDRMLTPALIQVVFWIGVALSVLVGLVFIFSASGSGAIFGLLYIVLGPLVVRVWCELVIVIFRIHSTLAEIRDLGLARPEAPATAAVGQGE